MNFQTSFQNLIPGFLSHGARIASILIAAYFISLFLKIFIGKTIKKIVGNKMSTAKRKRTETLMSIVGGTSKFMIGIIALLMILPEFGVNIGVLLTGMGLIGLAIGMAAREIISDFLSGLFIILEDQYNVGDRVRIAGIEGEVQELTLRKTVIKDETGFLHLIPNSQIKLVSKKKE